MRGRAIGGLVAAVLLAAACGRSPGRPPARGGRPDGTLGELDPGTVELINRLA